MLPGSGYATLVRWREEHVDRRHLLDKMSSTRQPGGDCDETAREADRGSQSHFRKNQGGHLGAGLRADRDRGLFAMTVWFIIKDGLSAG